eukprot:s6481_g4.t1
MFRYALSGSGESKLFEWKEKVASILSMLCFCVLRSDHTVRTWNLQSREALQVLSGHKGWMRGRARLSDTQLASCALPLPRDHRKPRERERRPDPPSVSSETGEKQHELRGHAAWVLCLCQASAELMASGSHDRTVWLWSLSTWTTVRILENLTGRI